MKNSLYHLLPALALLTLGGCAGTSALSTTENDGVYYSSQDRTTRNASASVASTAPAEETTDGEISNPDYATEGQRTSTVTETTEYYDEDYAYSSRIRRFHQPYYRGFGYGYNDFVYADPFWYGGPASYGYGNGFYDPFWGPSYGYGSYVNINIGFGSPWGWGYNPWRYGRGYGYGGFDNYYGGGYGGYGGFGGYRGYGYNNYYNINNYYGSGGSTVRNVRYGRSTSVGAEAGTSGRTGTGTGVVTGSRSRRNEGGIAAPTGGRATSSGLTDNSTPQPTGRGRTRTAPAGTVSGVAPAAKPETSATADQPVRTRQSTDLAEQPVEVLTQPIRRQRNTEATNVTPDAAPQPQTVQPRRSRYSNLNTSEGSSGQNQSTEQPVRRQRTYQAPQRTYEAPQRTYEAPQRSEQPSRSYEAPQRSYSEPSRGSSPSNGGGDNGGGGRGRGRN